MSAMEEELAIANEQIKRRKKQEEEDEKNEVTK